VLALGQQTAAVGVIDTPTDGQGGVSGSLAVTGWAIDDIEITRLRIMRGPIAGEGNEVFVGDAIFVSGARPDVAALNPQAPRFDAAGWGLLVLTNYLPKQGNGTFTLL